MLQCKITTIAFPTRGRISQQWRGMAAQCQHGMTWHLDASMAWHGSIAIPKVPYVVVNYVLVNSCRSFWQMIFVQTSVETFTCGIWTQCSGRSQTFTCKGTQTLCPLDHSSPVKFFISNQNILLTSCIFIHGKGGDQIELFESFVLDSLLY